MAANRRIYSSKKMREMILSWYMFDMHAAPTRLYCSRQTPGSWSAPFPLSLDTILGLLISSHCQLTKE